METDAGIGLVQQARMVINDASCSKRKTHLKTASRPLPNGLRHGLSVGCAVIMIA